MGAPARTTPVPLQSTAAETEIWFRSTLARAERREIPFRHWLLADTLPDDVAHAIPALPFAPPRIGDTQGRRETHNSTRVFFSAENRAQYPVCELVASHFQKPAVVGELERFFGAPLAGNSLRIEYCQDTDAFWLEPHTDIGAKVFTMLVYLSDAPGAEDWGTDIYDRSLRHAGRAPGGFNRGLVFVPGDDTFHGVEKREIAGVRKSIIVNYVKPEWRARHELAYPDAPVVAR